MLYLDLTHQNYLKSAKKTFTMNELLTLLSASLVRKINKSFLFENTSNLTHKGRKISSLFPDSGWKGGT